MASEVDGALIEQQSSTQAIGPAFSGSRRWLELVQTDLWGMEEVSAARRLAALVALSVCLAVLVLLVLGY